MKAAAGSRSRVGRIRARAAAAGVVVASAYLAAAALSGHLSPLARRPLLDGLGPIAPYRWVTPPPDLASGNVAPTPGEVTLALNEHGSRSDVLVTDDAQVTLILGAGAFPPATGQDRVHLTITPVDPATLGDPDPPLQVIGNGYRIDATYEPSGAPVTELADSVDVILVYPLTPDAHVTQHVLIRTPNSPASPWTSLRGTDSPGVQQAQGSLRSLGVVAVAGDLTALPSPIGPSGAGNRGLAVVLLVAAACVGLVGIGLLARFRGRGRRRP